MSVLSCYRRNCENIMCDRYSYEYGYICDECLKELKLACRAEGSVSDNIISQFMESEKKDYDSSEWIGEALDKIFEDHRSW